MNDRPRRDSIPVPEAGDDATRPPRIRPSRKKPDSTNASAAAKMPRRKARTDDEGNELETATSKPSATRSRKATAPSGTSKTIYFNDADHVDRVERLLAECGRGTSFSAVLNQLLASFVEAAEKDPEGTRKSRYVITEAVTIYI